MAGAVSLTNVSTSAFARMGTPTRRHVELLQRCATAIELLNDDEQIHVVGTLGLDPQPRFRVADFGLSVSRPVRRRPQDLLACLK